MLRGAIELALSRGASVRIWTMKKDRNARGYEECARSISLLESMGCEVIVAEERQANLAIVDKKIVWYGDVSLMAFNRKDEQILRFESASIAHELLDS